tara:strand:- start:480 stop:983 length:504 start_codon:yes stop_codon:yes gene_type:complete
MIYAWKKGSRIKVNPQESGEELERIRDKYGKVETEVVIDEARSEDSPIHKHFVWDDQAASELYRKDQARHLINAVRVVTDEGEVSPVPVFVNVREESGNYYQNVNLVVQEPDLWKQVLNEVQRKLMSYEDRLSALVSMEQDKERVKGTKRVLKSLSQARQEVESLSV